MCNLNVCVQDQLDEGVKVVYVKLPNVAIELLHPLQASGAVAKFLEKNPSGGIHHLCFAVRFTGLSLISEVCISVISNTVMNPASSSRQCNV